jgi:adenylate cyclase class IV
LCRRSASGGLIPDLDEGFLPFLSVRNIESKFRCLDHEAVLARAVRAGASDEGWLHQRDQFYEVPRGRLKLRTIEGSGSELIAYEREDIPGTRASEYGRYVTSDPTSLADVLERALPRAGVLEKTRHLLILHNTRIHLDDVVGLGRFVELETVIGTQSDADAEREHLDVITVLGLGHAERIAVGYVDLFNDSG